MARYDHAEGEGGHEAGRTGGEGGGKAGKGGHGGAQAEKKYPFDIFCFKCGKGGHTKGCIFALTILRIVITFGIFVGNLVITSTKN